MSQASAAAAAATSAEVIDAKSSPPPQPLGEAAPFPPPVSDSVRSRGLLTDGYVSNLKDNKMTFGGENLVLRKEEQHAEHIYNRRNLYRAREVPGDPLNTDPNRVAHMAIGPGKDISWPLTLYRSPRIWYVDRLTTSDQIISENRNVNWPMALFKTPSNPNAVGHFESKCPGTIYPSFVDASATEHFVDLTFHFLHEKNQASMTLAEVVSKYGSNTSTSDTMIARITKDQLYSALGDVVDLSREDYHILPLLIRVKDVHSTFPMDMNCSFRSRVSAHSAVERARRLGIQKRQQNGEKVDIRPIPMIPWSVKRVSSCGEYEVLVRPYQSTAFSVDHDTTVYRVNQQVVNHPDFTRWISMDYDALEKELDSYLVRQVYPGNHYFYRVPCPQAKEALFTLAIWFLFEHFKLITVLGEERLPKNHQKDNIFPFKVHEPFADENTTGATVIYFHKESVDEVLQRRKQCFNRDSFLMNLEELQLTARPLQGPAGWKRAEAVKTMRARTVQEQNLGADLSVTISMAFEVYARPRMSDGLNTGQDSGAYYSAMSSAAAVSGLGVIQQGYPVYGYPAMPIQPYVYAGYPNMASTATDPRSPSPLSSSSSSYYGAHLNPPPSPGGANVPNGPGLHRSQSSYDRAAPTLLSPLTRAPAVQYRT